MKPTSLEWMHLSHKAPGRFKFKSSKSTCANWAVQNWSTPSIKQYRQQKNQVATQTPRSNPQLLENQKWPSCTRSDHQLPPHKPFHQLTSQIRADRSSSQGWARATRAGSLSFRNIPLRLRAAPSRNSCLSRSLTRSSPILVVWKIFLITSYICMHVLPVVWYESYDWF